MHAIDIIDSRSVLHADVSGYAAKCAVVKSAIFELVSGWTASWESPKNDRLATVPQFRLGDAVNLAGWGLVLTMSVLSDSQAARRISAPENSMHPLDSAVAALLKSGDDHWRAGRVKEARACYRRVLEADPANAAVAYYLGIIAHQMAEYDEAIRRYAFAAALGRRDPALFNNFGETYRALGMLAQAARCYREGLALAPAMAQLHNNLGLVHFAIGKLSNAAGNFEEAIRLQPDYAKAHRNYGRVLQDLGRGTEAGPHFEKAQARVQWPENTSTNAVPVPRKRIWS